MGSIHRGGAENAEKFIFSHRLTRTDTDKKGVSRFAGKKRPGRSVQNVHNFNAVFVDCCWFCVVGKIELIEIIRLIGLNGVTG